MRKRERESVGLQVISEEGKEKRMRGREGCKRKIKSVGVGEWCEEEKEEFT